MLPPDCSQPKTPTTVTLPGRSGSATDPRSPHSQMVPEATSLMLPTPS
ncbi:hypothetical protein SGR_175 [Streptomyces griseus subsp. griseus NBRC 13350]|uniref:Uncharacterized protein n=1 Tax=Streptomyces griseus subsp. griseus (strain JCM 4626 / CBS 651.72 / NBRC 13350 / KCC S-0626 / ISP 5235) TaxID=455632 RepID=B1VNI1_STRGG|nr:hypothetical protein SGR_175 [Streptomyces griseus subsp. griseus NBRC 13350]